MKFGEQGSRDALCGLIGLVVTDAEDFPDALRVCFVGGAEVEITKASRGVGAEVAHFVPMIDGRPDVASMSIWENRIPSHDA